MHRKAEAITTTLILLGISLFLVLAYENYKPQLTGAQTFGTASSHIPCDPENPQCQEGERCAWYEGLGYRCGEIPPCQLEGPDPSCTDGNECTLDICSTGVCINPPIFCDASDPCTTDDCNPQTGCVTTPLNCDDSVDCTDDSCLGGCQNVPNNLFCDDSDPCTNDVCGILGCEYNPQPCCGNSIQ